MERVVLQILLIIILQESELIDMILYLLAKILTFHDIFKWMFVYYKCYYFDWIDVSVGIDVNKTSASKESDICHYWYFLNYSFKFQLNVCGRCHYLLMISMNLNDITIINVKGSDYHCIISLISKSKAIKLIQNNDLTKKSGTLLNKKLLSNIKMGKEVLTFRDIEIGKKNWPQ